MENVLFLTDVANQTNGFVFDMESDFRSYELALIQVMLLRNVLIESPILLIEVQYLPTLHSDLFNAIRTFHVFFVLVHIALHGVHFLSS